jgi:hypothetical protein
VFADKFSVVANNPSLIARARQGTSKRRLFTVYWTLMNG